MPLLYLSCKHDGENRVSSNNSIFNFELPNEIPSQMMHLIESTVVLSGAAALYGNETDSTGIVIRRPLANFNALHGTRLWVEFINADIVNSRQILSNSSSESGKIPIPFDYNPSRKKYQYTPNLHQVIHTHGIDRGFQIQIFENDGSTSVPFGNSGLSVDEVCSLDLVFEYKDVI